MSHSTAPRRLLSTLVLLRHGQSSWNGESRFTGWTDVGLSEAGCRQAVHCGEQLTRAGLAPHAAHTSYLRRAVTTAALVLDTADRHWIPVSRSWRLNERHYGALQGQNKSEVRRRVGEEQFLRWRRAHDVRPPPLEGRARREQEQDARYAEIGEEIPVGESLADVQRRLLPYWRERILPDLRPGRTVLVVAHSNSIRALVKHLDQISDADVVSLNVPTGMPLVYELESGRPPRGPGYFLEPQAAAVAARAVAEEGRDQ